MSASDRLEAVAAQNGVEATVPVGDLRAVLQERKALIEVLWDLQNGYRSRGLVHPPDMERVKELLKKVGGT